MNIITQENINTASYIFMLMGGLIVLFGAVIVYLDRKTKLNKKRKK